MRGVFQTTAEVSQRQAHSELAFVVAQFGNKKKRYGSSGRKEKKKKPLPSIQIRDSAPDIPKQTPYPPTKSKHVATTKELVDSVKDSVLVAEKKCLRTG